jgi:hypothetical protein
MASRTAGRSSEPKPDRAGFGSQLPSFQDSALFAVIAAWVVAVWVFYAGPVVIAFALRRPAAPLAVAATAAVLVAAGFYLSPPGLERWLSALNRSFGVVIFSSYSQQPGGCSSAPSSRSNGRSGSRAA